MLIEKEQQKGFTTPKWVECLYFMAKKKYQASLLNTKPCFLNLAKAIFIPNQIHQLKLEAIDKGGVIT